MVPGEMLIVDGSARSVGGPNVGNRALLHLERHYPVEAVCSICGDVVRREKPERDVLDWPHTGRSRRNLR
jgi:hypothetical protein